MVININKDNLTDKEVDIEKVKARALLSTGDKILIAHYSDLILLPGGSKEENETIRETVTRELLEETGVYYKKEELTPELTIKYYQKNYLNRNNQIVNRKVTTVYYVGEFKGMDLSKIKRTDEEIKANFYVELVTLKELFTLLNEKTKNPRKEFFDTELAEVIRTLKIK